MIKKNGCFILKAVILNKNTHCITGNTTGYINGTLRTELPYKLEIMKYDEPDSDVYLLHVSQENKVINDTWHQTIEDAIEQAKYEFNVDPTDWKDLDQ